MSLMFNFILGEQIDCNWLYKTSLIDITHPVRKLLPYRTFKRDNTDFVYGYIEEVKPYHVFIKDFSLVYATVADLYPGDITDFDVPATFNVDNGIYISPILENDPDYSSKTTYTTFFSFIILSIEIEYSCSPSIFTLSDISNVIRMIDYIITNHSSTPEVEAYTRNMLDMGIIEHVIRGLIEFNNSRRFDKESIEKFKQSLLHKRHGTHDEHKHKITSETSASIDKTSTDITTVTPTNSKPNRFVQFWRNLSCCCRCRKSRKNSIILDDKLEEKLEEKDNQDQVSKINDDDIKNKYLAQDLP